MNDKGNNKGLTKNTVVKLDMTFDDALRLAAKTPSTMTIPLPLNEKVELKNISGMILEFVSLTIDCDEPITEFCVLMKYENIPKDAIDYEPLMYGLIPAPLTKNKGAGVFRLQSMLPDKIDIPLQRKVFLILTTLDKVHETKVKSGVFTYKKYIKKNIKDKK